MSPLIEYLDRNNCLKLLPRTGWLLNGVQPCESVADHTTATALLAVALAGEVNREWAEEGLAEPLDLGRVALIALFHDLAESILTDLPKRSAQLIGAQMKHTAEATALAEVVGELAEAAMFQAFWGEYDESSTPEARLVHDADKLEMVHQALRYAEAGHRTLGEFWEGHRWHYAAAARLYDALRERRG
jgi:putative hydrolase of HD superfamily